MIAVSMSTDSVPRIASVRAWYPRFTLDWLRKALAEVVLSDGDFPAADPKLSGAPQVENGFVIGENRPGFGVELDTSVVAE